MQQFVVPQFIDVEDKIFGPITVRQFLIMLAGGIAIFLSYRFADTVLFIFLLALFGGLTLLFAFVKINGQAFHYFLLNVFQNAKQPSLRVWGKGYSNKELQEFRKPVEQDEGVVEEKKPQQRARIRDLSLVVNTGGYYRGDE